MVLRRLLVVGLFGLVVFVGAGFGRATTNSVSTGDGDSHPVASCVAQVDCGGGSLVLSATVLVALPVVAGTVFRPAAVLAVLPLSSRLRSYLLAGRLFRPPRAS